MDFDYFYGRDSEGFRFIRLPIEDSREDNDYIIDKKSVNSFIGGIKENYKKSIYEKEQAVDNNMLMER